MGPSRGKAEAYADTVSVTATISGTKTGVAGGASLSDSSAQTLAAARGIEGGAGHDRIRNDGEIDAKAISGADTTSVTVSVNGSLTGVAGGAALSDASAASLSDASGISGGDGSDEIANAASNRGAGDLRCRHDRRYRDVECVEGRRLGRGGPLRCRVGCICPPPGASTAAQATTGSGTKG